jgi:hypothetical protein
MLPAMKIATTFPLIALALISTPALAEVKPANPLSFLSRHGAEVQATPDQLWQRLLSPKDWWNPDHSWSGSVAGFYIEPKAGGCFCELFQKKDAKGKIQTIGSVEHMRVIYADPGKALRMQGALGPLQSEAVLATLTVAIQAMPDGKGSKISFNYMVGGHTRFPSDKIATSVDRVLAEQFGRLLTPYVSTAADAIQAQENPPSEETSVGAPKSEKLDFDLKDIEKKSAEEQAAPNSGDQPGKSPDPKA